MFEHVAISWLQLTALRSLDPLSLETGKYMLHHDLLARYCGQAERCRLSVGHSQALEAGMDGNGTAGFPGAVSALRWRNDLPIVASVCADVSAIPSKALPPPLPYSISGNFIFDPSSHQDFLGAIVGTGISREKLGDIIVQVLVEISSVYENFPLDSAALLTYSSSNFTVGSQGEKGALAIVVPELVEFLVTNLKQVC